MVTFRPSFPFWPRPAFLGDSNKGLSAWIARRDGAVDRTPGQQRLEHIRQIIENHHDSHAQTIYPLR
jgi:hypothetical protein